MTKRQKWYTYSTLARPRGNAFRRVAHGTSGDVDAVSEGFVELLRAKREADDAKRARRVEVLHQLHTHTGLALALNS